MAFDDIVVPVRVPRDRIIALLCSAFESGSYYWCSYKGVFLGPWETPDKFREECVPKNSLFQDVVYHAALTPGCHVKLAEFDETGETPDIDHELGVAQINRGLDLLFKEYPDRAARMLDCGVDAWDGDVFLQLCLFGEVKYV